MALYKYLRPVDNSLLDPHGPLSSKIESSVISEVNRQVTAVQEQTNRRGEYMYLTKKRQLLPAMLVRME